MTWRSDAFPTMHTTSVPVSSSSRSTALSSAPSPAFRVMPNDGQRGVLQRLLRGEPEELRVARVRSRPSALDERHPELVDLVQDPQAILDRVRQAGLLRAVAERGVVQLDLAAHAGRRAVVMRSPAPPRGRRPPVWRYPISPARIDAIFVHAKRMPSDTRAAAPSSPSCAQQHLDRADRGQRVDRGLAHVVGRGAADRLEHADAGRVDVAARGDAHAALDHRPEVRDDVAEHVVGHDHVEPRRADPGSRCSTRRRGRSRSRRRGTRPPPRSRPAGTGRRRTSGRSSCGRA